MTRRFMTITFLIAIPLAIWFESWLWSKSADQIFDRIYYAVFGMFIWRMMSRLQRKYPIL